MGIPILIIGVLVVQSILVAKSVESSYSYLNRTSELSLILDVLFKNPVLGNAVIKQNGSNGLIRFLWSYGYLAVGAVCFIGFCIVKNRNRISLTQQKLAFAIWWLLVLINEPIEYFNFTFLIVAFVIIDTSAAKRKNKNYSSILTDENVAFTNLIH